ncbi:phosphoglyceromutase [Ornatilinea apprima]|uniref:2,3-bisphosphoglycerate-dependent phosphoglycerate mutase n=1 Tax=Ornatilinea apprima TaxID=1134406 RepID=A0A0P6XSW6_9CHLR|nr:2,3-diphosphoglycerate-dependent phosphoglycerate mutase [Ornatilinea apprima]KPL76024.1 phosphoglyceromutase [Ornatilinea apprima]
MSRLVLLRHGESVWNRENRFTGWTDVDLTRRGVDEAWQAGRLLRDLNFHFDCAFTSCLKRAVQTLWMVLDAMDLLWVPTCNSWRLNERHYGALQGFNKAEMGERLGKEKVFTWRRTFRGQPPQLSVGDPRHPRFDARYKDVPANLLPAGESLEDTLQRVLPYWQDVICKEVQQNKNVLVVAHGNSLRALVTYLNQIDEEQVPDLQIPTGIPLVYEMDGPNRIERYTYLKNPDQERHLPISHFFAPVRQKNE